MVPPHSVEAEQSLLGALLVNDQVFDRIADVVREEDFYRDDHRRIWRHITQLVNAGKPVDLVTLWASLEESDDRDKTGGPAYLAEISQNTPGAANARRYAELIREKSLLRRLAQVGTEIIESAMNAGGRDAGRVLDEAEMKVLQISEAGARAGIGPAALGKYLSKVYERADQLHQDGRDALVTGVSTGFIDLDVKTSGFQEQDLILIAGRPSMGKTAMALNIAEHVALKEHLPVAIFSMEMSGTQLAARMLSSVSKVDQHGLRTGRLTATDWERLSEGMAELNAAPVIVDESGALSAMDVRARTRRLKREHGKLGLVVIDYLQLMPATSQGSNRATEISEVSRMLKAMAKELNVPVVALSQLSRSVDSRPDKRPIMSDLRDSGALEQDADVIIFLYREVVYKPDLDNEYARGKAEAIIGKQRNGPIGTVPLTFLGQYTRFMNYTEMDRMRDL